jgi:hypothetical protein
MRRRLPRILLNAATVLSLVLCAACVVLWVRSQWVTDLWRSYRVDRAGSPAGAREAAVATYRSGLAFRVATDVFVTESFPFTGHPWEPNVLPPDVSWSHRAAARTAVTSPLDTTPGPLGFLWERVASPPPTPPGQPIEPTTGRMQVLVLTIGGNPYLIEREYTAFGLPWWLLFLLCVARPAVALRRRIAGRPRPPGLCPSCGYDLRATPARCPECGTPAAAATPPPPPA